MKVERRVAAILGVVALVAVPAAVLRVLCVGASCEERESATRTVPFCSLPSDIRAAIAAGYREGRSPDVMAVTRPGVEVISRGSAGAAAWPALDDRAPAAPVVFWGRGVRQGADPRAIELADVAPSLAALAGFEIPHPEVRSGKPIAGLVTGRGPRALLLIVLRDVPDASSDPVIRSLADGGLEAEAEIGSLPADPAALHATIGTGGIPAEHGITGSTLRNDAGAVSEAWRQATRAPRSVIATLADDLDEFLQGRPLIALVADSIAARGLIGGNWYIDNDVDRIEIGPAGTLPSRVGPILARGFGTDPATDVLAVSLRTTPTQGASPALHLIRIAQRHLPNDFAAAVVALPAAPEPQLSIPAHRAARAVDRALGRKVVAADGAGGLFLDQEALARARITKDDVVEVLRGLELDGRRVFADVFPGLAVSFARFC